MSHIVVIGDIHGKTIWKDIIKHENPDFVIFLGDYVSTHKDETTEQQFHNLLEILRYKESCPERIILLRGNHDNQHLNYSWAECCAYNVEVANKMVEIKDRFLQLTQWVYPVQIEDKFILFSHAGVSNTWLTNLRKATGIYCINDINKLEPSEWFGFIPETSWDSYGESVTQPCTWIRPRSLIQDMPEGIIQVVGHTPTIEKCINVTQKIRDRKQKGSKGYEAFKDVPDLWLCDSLDNNSYLTIDNGIFTVKILDYESTN